jgi:hypothetical protein
MVEVKSGVGAGTAAKPGASNTGAQAPTQAKSSAKAPAAPKEPKAPREKTVAKQPLTARIMLKNDKEGKKFGADNNPKRGTAAKRFALYRDNMTIKEALDAGVKAEDISWDAKKGWIGFATA